MTEHTADLRREEIARIAEAIHEGRITGCSPRSQHAAPYHAKEATALHDLGIRSQDTATARIAALEGAITKLLDVLDRATMPADDSTPLYDYLDGYTRNTVDWARAVLSGETRTGGNP